MHWRHLPLALAPTPDGPDQHGVFSGCAVDRAGVPALVYTGIFPEVQCLAEAADPEDLDLTAWRKHPANPVIAAPPQGLAVTGFRDPFIWREEDGWYCAIGSGAKDGGGMVLLYRSPDLVRWEYLHELCRGDVAETGTMWECPNLVPIGDRHALLVSVIPLGTVFCMTGAYRGHRFVPAWRGLLDHGGSFYAPQVMLDAGGRRLMWGWLREERSVASQKAAGWSGVMSLPSELTLGADGIVRHQPVAELASLRGAHRAYRDIALRPEPDDGFAPIAGTHLEIHAVLAPGAGGQAGLHLLASPDGAERTSLYIDRDRQEVVVDLEHSSTDPAATREVRRAPVPLAADGSLALRVFLDGSVIEVFAGDLVRMSSRAYPAAADSCHVRPFARGAPASLRSLDVWEMRSIWE